VSSDSESPLDDGRAAGADNSDDTDTSAPSLGTSHSDRVDVVDRLVTRLRQDWGLLLVTASAIAAVGLTACLYVLQYRPDRQIDDAAARGAIQAASAGAVATLSYSSDSMERDFAKARSHLTGDFLAYYDKFTKDFVLPAVQNKQLAQTATVVRAAVSELEPNSAVVLVFLNETTVSRDRPQPLITPSGVRITLTKVTGSWLISKLDPVA